MILSPETIAFLMAASLMAGCIDAMAGGGGLIALPALLAAGIPPVPAVATNKLQSALGTFGACLAYARAGHMDLKAYRWPICAAFAGSAGGAWLLQRVDSSILAGLMPALLIALAAYFTFSPKVGEMDRRQRVGLGLLSLLIGVIGFYDGFFGPGAGTFYTTTLVALRGYGLTKATGLAKLINLTSACASLLLFALGGHLLWLLGLCMAAGAMAGGWLGSHSALKFGARLIRPLLVTISLALTARLLWGYFAG